MFYKNHLFVLVSWLGQSYASALQNPLFHARSQVCLCEWCSAKRLSISCYMRPQLKTEFAFSTHHIILFVVYYCKPVLSNLIKTVVFISHVIFKPWAAIVSSKVAAQIYWTL